MKLTANQFLRVMKLTTFIILAVCLHTSANTKAQQTVTFSGKEVSLENVFNAIKKQTSYRFFFNTDAIQHASKVSIDVKNAPIEQVMTLALKDQQLTYAIKGRTIFIMKKPEEPKASSQQLPPSGDPVTVSGRVTDENGNPLAGANVKVKGSNAGVTTDNQGRFTLNVDPNATIEISFVGHETQSLSVKGKGFLTIALGQKLSVLDETVVIAYGTTTTRFNTGNVSSVKAGDIERQPVNNPLLALQGKVPGLEIIQSTGVPGSGVTVRIRGQNSIQNGNDPLYIIDGVPYSSQNLVNLGTIWGGSGTNTSGNPLSYINPSDIESIDVLKDADATAIYGSRGANGVILITTKKGRPNLKDRLTINAQSGVGQITKKLDLLNTDQYLEIRHEALTNDGVSTIPSSNYDLVLWDTTRYTDWQKTLIGRTAHYKDIQMSVSGGTSNVQYLLGAGYHKESTVFPGDLADQKGNVHFNINNGSTNKRLRIGFSGIYQFDYNRLISQDLTSLATTLVPIAPAIYKDDGSLNWQPNASGLGTWTNPLAYLNLSFKNRTDNFLANTQISYNIIKGLDLKGSFGYTLTNTRQSTTSPLTYSDPYYWPINGTNGRSSRFATNITRSWIIEPQAVYTTRINHGELVALIGTTLQQNMNSGEIINAKGFNSDLVLEDMKSASSITIGSTVNSTYKYNALFGRVNYNYKDKYLLNLTARRDGTSRFGPNNRFHNFGAAGLGWIFTNEKMVKSSIPFLSFGKLRTSYGITGSDQIGDYSYLDLYNSTSVGVPYQNAVGLQINNLYNPDLAWEVTKKLEFGFESGFLRDRIFFSASYYLNNSSNQLASYSLASVTGFYNITKNLNAKVQNNGWEFLLNTVNIKSKEFQWSTKINLSMNRNKLVTVDSSMNSVYKRMVGYPLGTQYVYHYIGVNSTTGVYQFDDGYGNATTRPDTAYLITSYPINKRPKFYGGIQNTIQIKGFQIDFTFQFVKQIGINNFFGTYPGYFSGGLYNQPVSVMARWQKPGDIAKIQRLNQNFSYYQQQSLASTYSDAAYTDASFIRLKNISVSWTVPKQWSNSLHFQDCRLYCQGQNLITITKYIGMDPETQSTSSLPPLKVLTFGIQVSL